MILLRSLIFQAFLILSTLLFSLAILAFGTLRQGNLGMSLAQTWGIWNLAALKAICGLSWRVQGADHFPDGTAIVLSKHQSAWEILALRALLPAQQTWVLKHELMKLPVFGAALRRLYPIAIDRDAGRKAMIQLVRDGENAIKEGRWLIVFPEGTRVAPGNRQPYAIGGALLAERTGAPVVPIAHNAGCFWGRERLLKYPGVIDMVVGPIIDAKGRKAADINAETEEWIEKTCATLPCPPLV